jgi:hypothetical protein
MRLPSIQFPEKPYLDSQEYQKHTRPSHKFAQYTYNDFGMSSASPWRKSRRTAYLSGRLRVVRRKRRALFRRTVALQAHKPVFVTAHSYNRMLNAIASS